MPELYVAGIKTKGLFFARLALSSGMEIRFERYDGEFDDPTIPDDIEYESVPETTNYGYIGSTSLTLGVNIGNIRIGPNLTIRIQPNGFGAESGLFLLTSIF